MSTVMMDTPQETTATMDTPQETTATKRPRGRPPKASQDQEAVSSQTSGTSASVKDKSPEDYAAEAEKKALRGLTSDVAGLYSALGALLGMANPLAGSVIVDKAQDRAKELVNACKHNPTAMRWLKKLTSRSDVTKAIMGHGIMAVAIGIAADRIQLSDRMAGLMLATGYKGLVQTKFMQMQKHQQEAENGTPQQVAA